MKQALRWLIASGLCLVGLLLSWFFFLGYRETHFNQRTAEAPSTEKSVAVLPFENISANKDDAYFADGVQDEILNDLGKVAQLKVISRTSVMKYRVDTKRDLRQIANALGVANVLEGAVRRNGNRVRVSTELIDARTDDTIWADSYDRDLTDIFAIQSEVAQTIAAKLTATLSPQEKESIEAKPTENLAAYDFYLRGKELVATVSGAAGPGNVEKPLLDAVFSLEQAVRLDPKFTLAYCELAQAHDLLYEFGYDLTPERRALADAAINSASGLQPDLPEVHLARAYHLYENADYEQARVELTIARRGLPNDARAIMLEAMIDRSEGHWEKSIQKFNQAIAHDPRNSALLSGLAVSFVGIRQFRAAEQVYARLIELLPDQPTLKVEVAAISFSETGDDTAVWSAIAALPPSIANDSDVLAWRLCYALIDRNWAQAKELIENMKGSVYYEFAYAWGPVPIGCFSILLARVQGERPGEDPGFAQTQTELKQNIQKPQPLPVSAQLLSSLAVVDALLGHREEAISEARRAVEMCPISKDAMAGPGLLINLAVVYAWTNELDLAFETLGPLTKTPWGIYYGDLKRDPYWEPLRKDARYEKLLAELAPRD